MIKDSIDRLDRGDEERMMTIPNKPEQLADAWTRLYRAKENYDALTDEVTKFLYEYVNSPWWKCGLPMRLSG